jgi:hypothetical protein
MTRACCAPRAGYARSLRRTDDQAEDGAMIFKYVAALVAVVLVLGYLLAPVFKLKEMDLGIVIIAGLAMMLADLWQSLKSKED